MKSIVGSLILRMLPEEERRTSKKSQRKSEVSSGESSKASARSQAPTSSVRMAELQVQSAKLGEESHSEKSEIPTSPGRTVESSVKSTPIGKTLGYARKESPDRSAKGENKTQPPFKPISRSPASPDLIDSFFTVGGPSFVKDNPTKELAETSTYPFTYDSLLPSKPLQCYPRNTFFSLTAVEDFNKAFIVPKMCYEFMQLQDDVQDCEEMEEPLKVIPPVGSVVITLFRDVNYRAIVVKIIDATKSKVMLVDLGCFITVSVNKMKPANWKVMKHKKFGYTVKLKDVKDSTELVLKTDFDRRVEPYTKYLYRILSLQYLDEEEPYTVILLAHIKGEIMSLSRIINVAQMWTWELLFNQGYLLDTDILNKGENENLWLAPTMVDDAIMYKMPLKQELEGEISSVCDDGCVFIVNVTDGKIEKDLEILQNQINRYIDKVVPSHFFPMLSEAVLVFLNEVPQLQKLNLRSVGKWNRCYRESFEYFRNLDLDEIYPINCPDLIVRKITPDLFRVVPIGKIACKIRGFKPPAKFLRKVDVRPDTRFKFTVESYDDENQCHLISSPEVEAFLSCCITSIDRGV